MRTVAICTLISVVQCSVDSLIEQTSLLQSRKVVSKDVECSGSKCHPKKPKTTPKKGFSCSSCSLGKGEQCYLKENNLWKPEDLPGYFGCLTNCCADFDPERIFDGISCKDILGDLGLGCDDDVPGHHIPEGTKVWNVCPVTCKKCCNPPATTTTTTTQPPIKIPPQNCQSPGNAKTCHFWGDPHFTHLFNSNPQNNEPHKGGRMHGPKVADFNPRGVFELTKSADGDFEAQAFFCPAYAGTTTGVGLAMRFGDDIIQVIRGEATKPNGNLPNNHGHYADLTGSQGPESEFTLFYLNGEKKSWSELGGAGSTATRGKDVPGSGGIASVSAYLQQMKTVHESEISMLPVCAGDGKNLVEVSTPWFNSNTGTRVYEHAVTIRSTNPSGSGICGSGNPTSNGESFRVDRKQNLFSSKQMKSLCSQCRMDMNGGECGAPGHSVSAQDVCTDTGGDYNAAKKACLAEFLDGTTWLDVCIMESCASGDGLQQAVAIAKVEEQIQMQLEQA